jgi:prepilin-type N-terminal cleavage/methylation domain-containing protein
MDRNPHQTRQRRAAAHRQHLNLNDRMHMSTANKRRTAFTLIELLVVIGIIAILISLLLPALTKARWQAEIINCAGRLRAFGTALHAYAAEYREFPVTSMHRVKINVPDLLLQGEHAGFLGPDIRNLLIERKFTTDEGMQCSVDLGEPSFPFSLWNFSGNVGNPYYCYSGPSMIGQAFYGAGHTSGLEYKSQLGYHDPGPFGAPYVTNPHYWGVSIKNKWRRPQAVCPSIGRVFSDDWGAEPHEDKPRTCFSLFQLGDAWNLRRRNYLWNDGSVEYVRLNHKPPPDPWN